ncbi:MAG: formylglycine-generating enzyme family protein [Gemmatimonadaceae bacterium]|nr:formylglycine-generating enzyme family protein [Gemmatimonadaceae bacterium]
MRSRHAAFLTLIAIAVPGTAMALAGVRRESVRPTRTRDMARLPAGTYRPLHTLPGEGAVRVAAFALDRRPVTRAEFLAFVRLHPAWRRDSVRTLLAEPSYLAQWPGVLDAGRGSDLQRPVTGVSWFAASSFCAARGKRLPTLDEWEYAAAASNTRRNSADDPAFRRKMLELYAARSSAMLPIAGSGAANVYGIRDLHGSAWEWTRDFNSSHRLYCASGAIGAADPTNYSAFMRSAFRAALTARATLDGLGFRCAADQPV